MMGKRIWFGLVSALLVLALADVAQAAAWNLIVPGETHYNDVVVRLGEPTVRTREKRAFKYVSDVLHAVWEAPNTPEGIQRVDIIFNDYDLLPLIITVVPSDMQRSKVIEVYGSPERSEDSSRGLVDNYDILGLKITYLSDGKTVRRLEFFEGVRGRYGR